MARHTTPRPCITCGADSVRPLLQPAGLGTGSIIRVEIRCANPSCLALHDSFEFAEASNPTTNLTTQIDRALAAYEQRIVNGSEFTIETEAGLIIQ
jgi:hypothetical protein